MPNMDKEANHLESYIQIISGEGGHPEALFDDLRDEDRQLQMTLPDYTSPPLPDALALTPEEYRDDEVVEEARELAGAGNCTLDGNRCQIPFPPSGAFEDSRVGVVFYNGGLVDPRGYSPIASILNERYGIPVVMPIFEADLAFVFGVCDTNRLDFAKAEFPNVEKWVLVGHSFGGVAASVDMWSRWGVDDSAGGLVLLAADNQAGLGCGDLNFGDTELPMAQVLASGDGVLNTTRVSSNAIRNPENSTFFVEITGANHASFGSYDYSERFALFGQVDGESLIPSEVAWDTSAAAIANVAARTGVTLPKAIPTATQAPTEESSGAASLHSSPFLSMWSTIVFFGWFFFGRH